MAIDFIHFLKVQIEKLETEFFGSQGITVLNQLGTFHILLTPSMTNPWSPSCKRCVVQFSKHLGETFGRLHTLWKTRALIFHLSMLVISLQPRVDTPQQLETTRGQRQGLILLMIRKTLKRFENILIRPPIICDLEVVLDFMNRVYTFIRKHSIKTCKRVIVYMFPCPTHSGG